MRGDLEALTEEGALGLAAREFTFFNADSLSRAHEHARIGTL